MKTAFQKSKRNLLLKLVRIEWVDSSAGSGWMAYEGRDVSDDGPFACCSVGWAIAISEDSITVSSNVGGMGTDNMQFHSTMSIPMCAVLKITVLK